MDSTGLDQKEWKQLTSWRGDPPSHSAAWTVLTSPQLPSDFGDLVRSLNHQTLRKLKTAGEGLFELGPESKMEAGAWNNKFANLVSGRFRENLFYQTYS